MKDNNVIVKIYENKQSGQKLVTIPKDSPLKDGDWVTVSKLEIKKED
jgi:hypothetical protein